MNFNLLSTLLCGALIAAGNLGAAVEKQTELEGTWIGDSILRDPPERDDREGKNMKVVMRFVGRLPSRNRARATANRGSAGASHHCFAQLGICVR